MTLLAVERIKLLSTRSPWWCAVASIVLAGGFTAIVVSNANEYFPVTVATTQFGYSFGLAVVMVLGALSVTTEYRFGTIRTTFAAVPSRTKALLAKAAVVGALALLIGELTAFASWGISLLLAPDADLALNTTADIVNVTGVGAVYALTAVLAVAVGLLVRHSAGAISLLLIYTMVVEGLVQVIPQIGDDIYKWMPFNVADKFLTGGSAADGQGAMGGMPISSSPLSPAWALAYFAGFALVTLVVAIIVTNKRDA